MGAIVFKSFTRIAPEYKDVFESFQDAIYSLEDDYKEYLEKAKNEKNEKGQQFWLDMANDTLTHRNILNDFYKHLYTIF